MKMTCKVENVLTGVETDHYRFIAVSERCESSTSCLLHLIIRSLTEKSIMKTLIFTTVFMLSVFSSQRVQCMQREQNAQAAEPIGENATGDKPERKSVVGKLQAKAQDLLDAVPGKAMEMLGELGPLPDQTREMMGKALDQSQVMMDKTMDMINPYIKKMDDIQPGVSDMVENIKKKAAETVENMKKMIRIEKDEL
ncbi:unnamed protein product [Larinioides sclopetarius]|uniref:Antifreeze protein n=1 Tax=Larinioides sclopetarius TaxID=280406 RepID=A0AAV2BFF2_9ARAC